MFYSRFLLARHKAAIDVYNEAEKMTDNDWVRKSFKKPWNMINITIFIYTEVVGVSCIYGYMYQCKIGWILCDAFSKIISIFKKNHINALPNRKGFTHLKW